MPHQLSLSDFKREFGFKNSTAQELIHTKEFPAYKIRGQWYVDIDAFLKWRQREHERNYKYY